MTYFFFIFYIAHDVDSSLKISASKMSKSKFIHNCCLNPRTPTLQFIQKKFVKNGISPLKKFLMESFIIFWHFRPVSNVCSNAVVLDLLYDPNLTLDIMWQPKNVGKNKKNPKRYPKSQHEMDIFFSKWMLLILFGPQKQLSIIKCT